MIQLIIKSYLIIFLSIGTCSILLLLICFYLLFRKSKKIRSLNISKSNAETKKSITITSRDINAISGENAIATQLDLARAYIETGRKQLAKNILLYAIERGDHTQQDEAKQLIIKIK